MLHPRRAWDPMVAGMPHSPSLVPGATRRADIPGQHLQHPVPVPVYRYKNVESHARMAQVPTLYPGAVSFGFALGVPPFLMAMPITPRFR